jgi:hypothetical protein
VQGLLRLRRFLDRPEPARKKTGCELCGAPLEDGHAHVVDVEDRRLLCTCRPCYLLFTHAGAAGGRFRSVSGRVLQLVEAGEGSWERLEIPVGLAFFLRDSARNQVAAFYPSPAGATEAALAPETWEELVESVPTLATLEPDIEALLLCRRDVGVEAWIVPVDACYELVGRIRREWKGFDGGRGAWSEIDRFLAGVGERRGA